MGALTDAELAAQLGVPANTLRSRRFRENHSKACERCGKPCQPTSTLCKTCNSADLAKALNAKRICACGRAKAADAVVCAHCYEVTQADPGERGSQAKLHLLESSRDYAARQARAHANAGVAAAHTARTSGAVKRAENEAQLEALGIYVSLETRIVAVRDAVAALVRAGGQREDLRRAMQDGVAAAQEDDDPVVAHAENLSARSGSVARVDP
jgi:hypothetical protein